MLEVRATYIDPWVSTWLIVIIGTNTDCVLLDASLFGKEAVLASHKTSTTSNVTLGVQDTLK